METAMKRIGIVVDPARVRDEQYLHSLEAWLVTGTFRCGATTLSLMKTSAASRTLWRYLT